MSWQPQLSLALPVSLDLKNGFQTVLLVFVSYWIAAEAAFAIGTLSDKIFAPFWPPNIVLLCVLLGVRSERRWICILAALLAHTIAESEAGMPASQSLVAFSANLLVALMGAAAIRRLLGEPPWFESFRKGSLFIMAVGFACPAAAAFVGALLPVLAGGKLTGYWTFWMQWFAANALGNLTLGPITLILLSQGPRAFRPTRTIRLIEAALLSAILIAACGAAFEASTGQPANGYLPILLYLPLILIFWSAARFGARGASATILLMTVVFIWRTLNGPSLFLAGTPENNVFALQIFLISLAVPVLLIGASIDDARRAEQRLRQDEERMAFVAAAANVGLWQYNAADGYFWATSHCGGMFGLRPDLPITRDSILSVVHHDDKSIIHDVMETTAERTSGPPAEFRIVLPGGQLRWILARTHLGNADDGETPGVSGIFTDITARKTSEAEFELQRRELAHLMRISQVGELSGGLAHELTQPLTAILANAQAARVMLTTGSPDIADITEVIDDIIQDDHRAGEVIHRLRTMLKNGKDKFEPLDINGLLTSTFRLLRGELISRRIKANIIFTSDPVLISGDLVQLQQVLLNLVMNSIDALNQMSTLRRVVTLKSELVGQNMIEISVSDRGTGINNADRSRLFETFFTTKEHGLGLGLSICSTIIKRHGGVLRLDNNADGGATARFCLPAQSMNGAS